MSDEINRASRSVGNVVRDMRCPDCGEMMTSHVVVTRHAGNGRDGCDEFIGPEIVSAFAAMPTGGTEQTSGTTCPSEEDTSMRASGEKPCPAEPRERCVAGERPDEQQSKADASSNPDPARRAAGSTEQRPTSSAPPIGATFEAQPGGREGTRGSELDEAPQAANEAHVARSTGADPGPGTVGTFRRSTSPTIADFASAYACHGYAVPSGKRCTECGWQAPLSGDRTSDAIPRSRVRIIAEAAERYLQGRKLVVDASRVPAATGYDMQLEDLACWFESVCTELETGAQGTNEALPGVSEPYASMTRQQLVDEIDRFARNYNELEKSRDGYKRQVQAYEEQSPDYPTNVAELAPLAARIAKGRAKYANGCTVLSLLDEAGEVAHAVNKYEAAERVREELLDVAAVAMRLYFGEVDRGLEIDGLVQRRTDARETPKRSDGHG